MTLKIDIDFYKIIREQRKVLCLSFTAMQQQTNQAQHSAGCMQTLLLSAAILLRVGVYDSVSIQLNVRCFPSNYVGFPALRAVNIPFNIDHDD